MNSINSISSYFANISSATKLVMAGASVAAATLLFIKIFRNHRPNVEVGKDSSIHFPIEVLEQIALSLNDPKDLIAFGGTNKTWRTAVNNVCRRKLKRIFSDKFLENKLPITAAADLWFPLRPQTRKLSMSIFYPYKWIPELQALLKALQEGTIEQLERTIDSIGDKTYLALTSHILSPNTNSSSSTGYIEIALEVLNTERIRILYDELMITPVFKGKEDRLKLLLENGGSFNVKDFTRTRKHTPLMYRMLRSIENKTVDDKILICVALAMKSWRYEYGFEQIIEDNKLAQIAGRLLVNPHNYRVGQFLMSCGVIPVVKKKWIPSNIKISVEQGNKEHLEYLSNQGLLDFKNHLIENLSLADYAHLKGQFELVNYLVYKKKVPYNQ